MKKKIATILAIAMMTLLPSTAKADLDVLSIVQDEITSITQKVDAVIKQYVNVQANLQELSLNRNIVSQIRDKVKTELKAKTQQFYKDVKDMAMAEGMMFLKSSLSSISLPGIGQYVDMGAFVNPKLQVAVGQTYLKRQHKHDDIKYIAAKDETSNNLMVDNAATLFANSLVRRVQIIEEDPCRCVDANGKLISDMPKCTNEEVSACEKKNDELKNMADVNSVKNKYYETVWNAHHRWLKISEAMSAYKKMKNEGELNQGNIDDVSDITGTLENEEEKEEDASTNTIMEMMQKQREANSKALYEGITSTIKSIKDGDAAGALSNALGNAANIYGNVPGSWDSVTKGLQSAATGVQTLNNMNRDAQSGNWGGMLNDAMSGAGSIVSQNGGGDVGGILSNAAGGAGSSLNSALSGNWGDAIRNAGAGAGSAVGGAGNETLGAAISAVGSLADVGIDAANAGGNLGNVLDNTIGSGQATGALSNLENAYEQKKQQDQQWLKATEEARKQQNEKIKQGFEELAKKNKQERCSKCNADNEARIKAGQPMISCFNECSL